MPVGSLAGGRRSESGATIGTIEQTTEPVWLEDTGAALRVNTRGRARRRRAAAGAALLVAALAFAVGAGVSARPAAKGATRLAPVESLESSGAPLAPVRSASIRARSLPFAPQLADRTPRSGEVPSMYTDGRRCSVGCRPYGAQLGWPLKPFHAEHPLRSGLNEIRPASLHVGVDIQARDGQAVYAVQPGVARVLASQGPDARVQVGRYVYWHITPTVGTGQDVIPFVTVLGRVMIGYGHIAFSELGARNQYVNPLRPGGRVLAPLLDAARPVIGSAAVAPDGQVVIGAYDPQTFIRRTTYVTPVLAPAALAFRLYDARGAPVTPLHWAFRGTHLLDYSARRLIYAPGTRAPGFKCFATRPTCVPEWTYRVAGGLAPDLPSWLPPARYRLTIYAWDWSDNETARDTTVRLTTDGWQPTDGFPGALLTGTWFTPSRRATRPRLAQSVRRSPWGVRRSPNGA